MDNSRDIPEDIDLIVVGYGAAGASTALTPAVGDARVVIIEKQPQDVCSPNVRSEGKGACAGRKCAVEGNSFACCVGVEPGSVL